ncbi:MAG: hypothetical protein ACR2GQ_03225 [Gemmatimonadota bacterium]
MIGRPRRHVSEFQLRNFDHSDCGDDVRGAVSRHLRECAGCRERLASIRSIRQAAAQETAPGSADLWPAIERRIGLEDEVLLPPAAGREPTRRASRSVRRGRRTRRPLFAAAVLLFATAVGVLAATRGSLPAWFPSLPGQHEPRVTEPAGPAGIEVPVPATGLVIDLRTAGAGLRLRVQSGGDDLASIELSGTSTSTRFVSGPDRVTIVDAEAGTLDVRIPATAAPVRITDDGTTLARVDAGRILLRDGSVRSSLDEDLSYVRALAGGRP